MKVMQTPTPRGSRRADKPRQNGTVRTPAVGPEMPTAGGPARVGRLPRVLPGWVWSDVVAPLVATRGMLMIVALLALSLMAPNPDPNKPPPQELSQHPWLNVWVRWDSFWHLSIAQNGYSYEPGRQSNVAFFPLYPLLVRAIALVLGRGDSEGYLVGGIIASNLALAAAVVYLIRLVRLDYDAATAARAGLYVLAFPTSLFLSAVFPDSLFLALAVATFFHARRGQWWIAAALGGAAALTRPFGVLIAVPLALEYLTACRFRVRATRPNVAALGLIPAGLGACLWFLDRAFADPLAFVHVQVAWERATMPPWDTLLMYLRGPLVVHAFSPPYSLIDLIATILFTIPIVAAWRVVRPSYALFSTLLFLAMITTGTLTSLMRYGATLFPVLIVLAAAGRHPAFDRAYVSVATGLSSLFMAMFALWYWVA